MDLTLRIFLFALSVLFLAFVLLRIRRGRYLLKYSLIWIILSIIGVVSAVFPKWIYDVSHLLGFESPSNLVYFALIGFLLIANVIFGGILSKQEVMIRSLIQEVSILKNSRAEASDSKTGVSGGPEKGADVSAAGAAGHNAEASRHEKGAETSEPRG